VTDTTSSAKKPQPPGARGVSSTRPFQVLRPSGPYADLDSHRAWRPSVLQGDGRLLRMWYSGHDGATNRILSAEQRPRDGWTRRGVSFEAGLAGTSDGAGVDAPSVVRTADGFLMAYAGSDGTATRVHLAASTDGDRWRPSGPFPGAGASNGGGGGDGADDATGSPSLLVLDDQLWLYYSRRLDDGRTVVVAAKSTDGTTWQTVGQVLGSHDGAGNVSEPWVVARDDDLLMLFVERHDDRSRTIGLATSLDGLAWTRLPLPLDLARRHHDAGVISGPSALQLRGGRLNVWYAAGEEGDTDGGCRLWATEITGRIG